MEITLKWERTKQNPMTKLLKCSTDSNVDIKVSMFSVQNKLRSIIDAMILKIKDLSSIVSSPIC